MYKLFTNFIPQTSLAVTGINHSHMIIIYHKSNRLTCLQCSYTLKPGPGCKDDFRSNLAESDRFYDIRGLSQKSMTNFIDGSFLTPIDNN
jgi:hypothetical protein